MWMGVLESKTDLMQNIQFDQVFEKVRDVISLSCGRDQDSIGLNQTVFKELGIDSIDYVDILFMLESAYGISLKVGDIERSARKEMGDIPFAINNIITPEGLELLKIKMPEIPDEKIKQGLAVHEIANLITVHTLCRMVIEKINQKS